MTKTEGLPIDELRIKFHALCRLPGGVSHICSCDWCELLQLALATETELDEKQLNFLEAHLAAELALRQG
ncbi:hypothetical protein ES708_26269 [subsurface metagenome]